MPTVVLVGGLRASADDWSMSNKIKPAVFPKVAKFTRVWCMLDRPGTPVGENPSRSDPSPASDHSEGCSLPIARPAELPLVRLDLMCLFGHSYGV